MNRPPEAVVEQRGRWSHLVYIRHGALRYGPDGHGWRVIGVRRAHRKARRVLAAYIARQTPPSTIVIRAEETP